MRAALVILVLVASACVGPAPQPCVECECGWDTPEEFWAAMYGECVRYLDFQDEWAVRCGFDLHAEALTCLRIMWYTGVSPMECENAENVLRDQVQRGACDDVRVRDEDGTLCW